MGDVVAPRPFQGMVKPVQKKRPVGQPRQAYQNWPYESGPCGPWPGESAPEPKEGGEYRDAEEKPGHPQQLHKKSPALLQEFRFRHI